MRKVISVALAVLFMASVAIVPASANTTWTSNRIQNINGVDYEFWADNGGGTMTIPTNANGNFSCEWRNINNILFRSGRKWDSRNRTHQQIGQITMNYNVSTWNVQGNSYLCLYGWTVDPLVEWYIIETYGSYKPSGNASRLGTATINGGTYELYRTTRTNQPSILGTRTFDQYWSIRTSNRRSGTVDVSAHFRAWENVGLRMGNLTEVALTVEGWQNSGNATVSQMQLTVGGSSSGGTTQPPAQTTTTTRAATTTAPPANNNNGASTRWTFANLSFASNHNTSSYSVSNGSLNVNYGGQHREVRYNLPSAVNLANCTSIVVNGQSANGQTAIKFFNSSGTEVFVMWNNRASSATNWTRNLSASDRNNTVSRIGIMSQDTGSYSATINSITFNGVNVSGGGSTTQPPAQTTTTTRAAATTTAPPASSGEQRFTFANMSLNRNVGVSSYSVSNGSLNVNYGGQHREVIYNLNSSVNLSNRNSIVVNGTSANGQTAIKFYNASGSEVFVMWNNRASSATNWTRNLSASDRNNTIARIGIMSQDTGSYSATINSVTFR